MFSPCHTHTIKTAWSAIETFLDLPSTIAVSQTCQALHDEIVDADSQKVKVSHFIAGDKTMPQYLPSALNAIYFPALRRIELSFPLSEVKRRRLHGETVLQIQNVTVSCFPLFVSGLACACNLESLHLSVGGLLSVNYNLRCNTYYNSLVKSLELFGRNLARCKKLKELVIFVDERYSPSLVRVLVLALTPALTHQRYVMRQIKLNITGSPIDSEALSVQLETLHPAAIDFFHSILCCPELLSLSINIPYSSYLTNSLMDAARQISPWEKHAFQKQTMLGGGSDLQRLCLCLCGVHWYSDLTVQDEGQYLEGAEILLEHFSTCTQIEDVKLGMSSNIWNSKLEVVAKLLHNKPKLSALAFIFGHYSDHDEHILELLKDCVMDKETNMYKLADLQVRNLNQVNGKRWFILIRDIKDAGGDIKQFDVTRNAYRNSEEFMEMVTEKMKEEDIPTNVDVDFLWMNHAVNFERRERELEYGEC